MGLRQRQLLVTGVMVTGAFLKNGEEGEVERCLIDLLADAAGKKNKREKLRQIASRELEL